MRYLRYALGIVAVAIVLGLGVRILVVLWAWPGGVPENRGELSWYLLIETVSNLIVWLAAGGVIVWLARRAAKVESDRRRLEHLAQVALLTGGLAHEVRNHLNAFGANLSLLRQSAGQSNGELPKRIEKLEHTATALDELMDDFLTLTRPVKDNLEQVDLAALANEVIEYLSMDLEQAQVQVRVDAATDIPRVVADRGKLRRVILNLLVNARQAMPKGGTAIVRLRSRGGKVQMDVEDSGCGIPPEDRSRIFEAFFSTKDDGTGLGLAVVKRTIEDLGGHISFDSTPGCGTTFHITLPNAAHHEATMRHLGRPPSEGQEHSG